MRHPLARVTEKDFIQEFGMVHLSGWRWPPNDGRLQFSDKVMSAPGAVYLGPWFLRVRVEATRPVITLEWWGDSEPEQPVPTSDGSAFHLRHAGRLRVPERCVSIFGTTDGGWGPTVLALPGADRVNVRVHSTDTSTVRERQRALVLGGESLPTDLEFWTLQFWMHEDAAD